MVAYILLKSQSLAVKIILFPYSSRTSMPFAQSTAMLNTTTKYSHLMVSLTEDFYPGSFVSALRIQGNASHAEVRGKFWC